MSEQNPPNRKAEQTGARAVEMASEGQCCAEALVASVIDNIRPETSTAIVPLMTGLCAGMGNKQATCGVFTGGAVALGLLAEELPEEQRKKTIKKLAAEYEAQLSSEAGGQRCHDLRKKMGLRNWNNGECHKLTGRGAELVVQIATQSGLVK